jgi:hypothetical protein
MPDAIVVGSRYRTPTTASRRENGGVVLRQGHRFVALDASEFDALVSFVRDEPELGKLARFRVSAESPVGDETAAAG